MRRPDKRGGRGLAIYSTGEGRAALCQWLGNLGCLAAFTYFTLFRMQGCCNAPVGHVGINNAAILARLVRRGALLSMSQKAESGAVPKYVLSASNGDDTARRANPGHTARAT